jgi:hypothetical protein
MSSEDAIFIGCFDVISDEIRSQDAIGGVMFVAGWAKSGEAFVMLARKWLGQNQIEILAYEDLCRWEQFIEKAAHREGADWEEMKLALESHELWFGAIHIYESIEKRLLH